MTTNILTSDIEGISYWENLVELDLVKSIYGQYYCFLSVPFKIPRSFSNRNPTVWVTEAPTEAMRFGPADADLQMILLQHAMSMAPMDEAYEDHYNKYKKLEWPNARMRDLWTAT